MANFVDKYFGRLGNRMFQSAYIYAQFREGNIPDIYLQDPKYFEKYANEIKQMFGEGITPENKVGVHFRRGKNPSNPQEPAYAHNPFMVDLWKTDYYQKAMSRFPSDKFILFSDDNNWLYRNFKGDHYEFAIGDEISDLKRFAGCKAHIIANSSWSWWGAYLGQGLTIYPKQWFADNIQRVGFPREWIAV